MTVAENCPTDGSKVTGNVTVTDGTLDLSFRSADKAINLGYIIIRFADGMPYELAPEEISFSDLRGDVDVSGSVNVADAVLLARFLAEDKEITVSAQGKRNAQLTEDENIDNDDLTKLLEYLAGINDTL